METRYPSTINRRSYEDFDPLCKWRREESRDILEAHLPGFRGEQVKVQVNHLGFIIISGERSLMDGTRWRRFRKEIEIPSHCNANAINARFMQSILTLVMPKQVNPVSHHKDQEHEHEQPHKDQKETAYAKMEFPGGNRTRASDEIVKEDTEEAKDRNEFEGETDAKLTPETTREVVLKAFVVVIIVLIASYVTDICKSMVADSYFLS